MARRIAVIGSNIGVAQSALTLAEMGAEVALITPCPSLGLEAATGNSKVSSQDLLRIWPLLLRAASHPRVTLYTGSQIEAIRGKQGKFTIRATRQPRYVREDLCTSCGCCEEACSVKITSLVDSQKVIHSAIHAPLLGAKAIPSAYCIEKNGAAPCRAACPLGIKVQGFISLLSKGKSDEALSLINEAAPLAGVLGRVCTHPCENSCKRAEIDDPVYIQALHRYAADNAPSGIRYTRKAPAGSRKEKIAIIGSGPAGLTAAWELARRGYTPTIFESHAVVGGMLATGIPRFRLPREVREREVEAIKALGVDIKTGITVGRDVTMTDLRNRGYKAFFIAIGAHQNNKLDIPGEDLDGVADSVSLLFTLNLKVGASVGSNVVVIGGGNSAVDSARTAKRQGKGDVRILYRRTAEEMTAVREDVEEAIKEGITIEYLTAPIEILGDGTRVTGIRCQRMKLGEVGSDGRRMPEPIPGSEFVIEADQVVAAIGQKPNTPLLNIKGLEVGTDATIKVDPLTLETNIPGIFAGGDCVSGPNNVVEAMAAGLQVAESIDRYLRGQDLRKGRSLEKPQAAQVDVKEREASKHKRAHMPMIHHSKRMGSFEETTLGLPEDVAGREAGRCLNCALCSECLECEQACELGAVLHKDDFSKLEIDAEAVIDFTDRYSSGKAAARRPTKPGIYSVKARHNGDLENELAKAAAVALEAAADLRLRKEELRTKPETTSKLDVHKSRQRHDVATPGAERNRIGLVLCNCGGSISSVIDFEYIIKEMQLLPHVFSIQQVSQACTEEGAKQIASRVQESKLSNVVLAACRCCNLEQVCFSCTDRRARCLNHISNTLISTSGIAVEFVNIREQCAWVHKNDSTGATLKAMQTIMVGIARATISQPATFREQAVESAVLIMGAELCGLAAAKGLSAQGYTLAIVSGPDTKEHGKHSKYLDRKADLLKRLEEQGIPVMPWPESFELSGSPGNYEVVLKYRSQTSRIKAGAIILDLAGLGGEAHTQKNRLFKESLLGRIIARRSSISSSKAIDSAAIREFTLKETAGIFLISSDSKEKPEELVTKGTAAAARASAYLSRGTLSPLATSVIIDSKLCRGCGDCSAICPYIEMRVESNGIACAYVDQALCLGCGACVSRCPTGAIVQPVQSDKQIISTLESLLGTTSKMADVR